MIRFNNDFPAAGGGPDAFCPGGATPCGINGFALAGAGGITSVSSAPAEIGMFEIGEGICDGIGSCGISDEDGATGTLFVLGTSCGAIPQPEGETPEDTEVSGGERTGGSVGNPPGCVSSVTDGFTSSIINTRALRATEV